MEESWQELREFAEEVPHPNEHVERADEDGKSGKPYFAAQEYGLYTEVSESLPERDVWTYVSDAMNSKYIDDSNLSEPLKNITESIQDSVRAYGRQTREIEHVEQGRKFFLFKDTETKTEESESPPFAHIDLEDTGLIERTVDFLEDDPDKGTQLAMNFIVTNALAAAGEMAYEDGGPDLEDDSLEFVISSPDGIDITSYEGLNNMFESAVREEIENRYGGPKRDLFMDKEFFELNPNSYLGEHYMLDGSEYSPSS